MIGRGLSNDQSDVLKLKEFFADTGRLERPQEGFNPFFDGALEGAIEGFQHDNNLKADGFLRPGGETERNIWRSKPVPMPEIVGPFTEISSYDLDIAGGVGNGAVNDPKDLQNVSKALGALDHFKFDRTANPPAFITKELEDGIRSFQREQNLLEDGQITPNGETIGALKAQMGGRFRDLFARTNQPAEIEHAIVRDKPGEGSTKSGVLLASADSAAKFGDSTGDPQLAEALVEVPGTDKRSSSESNGSSEGSEEKKGNAKEKEIKWESTGLPIGKGQAREVKVKDKVRVRLDSSIIFGVDQMHFDVEWHLLDKNGKIHEGSNPVSKKDGVGYSTILRLEPLTVNEPKTLEPPFKSPHGWHVKVSIPPQNPAHGNSSNPLLDITVPDVGMSK